MFVNAGVKQARIPGLDIQTPGIDYFLSARRSVGGVEGNFNRQFVALQKKEASAVSSTLRTKSAVRVLEKAWIGLLDAPERDRLDFSAGTTTGGTCVPHGNPHAQRKFRGSHALTIK